MTDGRSASLSWYWAPIRSPWPDFCFLSDDYGFLDVGHPLWREDGSVIYLYNCFWALPEQSLLCWNPAELMTTFHCLIWDSPNLESQVHIFIFPRNKVAWLYPRALGFRTRLWKSNQSWSFITTESQSASPSWCQAPIWVPWSNFPLLFDLFLDSCSFVNVVRPLWWEVGSVLFSICCVSSAQPFSDLSPKGLMSIFYCLYFWDFPNLEGQVPVFISPRNKVAQLYPQALGLSN
jgi:hypothetical protein